MIFMRGPAFLGGLLILYEKGRGESRGGDAEGAREAYGYVTE